MIRHLLLPSIFVGTLVQGLAFAQPPGGSLVTPPPLSQTQHEQLAKMPADVRIYEEFRYWSFQSPDVQKAALEHYVIALERQGVAPAERASRIAVIRERGRQLEVDRWNRILTAERPTFNTAAQCVPGGFGEGATARPRAGRRHGRGQERYLPR